MPQPGTATRLPHPFWWLTCCVALPLLALLWLGQDSNWDLRNYHLYNPHAWWQGRVASDIAPAQLQTWHNPLLDFPLYLLVRTGQPGWLVGLWLTFPTMLALYLLLRMQQALSPAGLSSLAMLVATLLAVSGAAAWSELGGSFNDAFVAAALLLALHRLTRKCTTGPRDWLLAGLAAGAIAGLKLTAATYCLGLAVAALFCAPMTRAPSRLSALFAGGMMGFALGYGYWGWHLQQSHGNPVFPYFNQFFHSPDALPEAYADRRFAPTSLFDGLLAPIHLAAGTQRHSEIFLRDPRLLLGLAAFIAAWWTSRTRAPITTARWRLLTLFYVASLLLWTFQYGIYRYALPLEMLAALPMVWLARQWSPRSAAIALCLMLLLVSVGTRRPDWSRQSFATPALRIDMPPLPANSLVVLSSREPLAFATLALDTGVPAISIYNNFMQPDRCTGLQAEAEARIRNHGGAMWLLRTPLPQEDEGARVAKRAYGLAIGGACMSVATTLGDLELCPLEQRSAARLCPKATPATKR